MTGNICIEGFQDVDIGHVFFDKRGCQFAGFTFGRKVHVLVWIQKRKKLILKLYCERFRVKGGILVSINLLIAGDEILTGAFGKRKYRLFIRFQKIGIDHTGGSSKLNVHAGIIGIGFCSQIPLILIGNIQDQRGTAQCFFAGGLRGEDSGRRIYRRFFIGGRRISTACQQDSEKQPYKKETDW